MNPGTYPHAFNNGSSQYYSYHVLVNGSKKNSNPNTTGVVSEQVLNTYSPRPVNEWIHCPSNLNKVQKDVKLAFLSIHGSLKKLPALSQPLKDIQKAMYQDIASLFNVFVELSNAHHDAAYAIRLIVTGSKKSPEMYLKNARDALNKARGDLNKVSEALLKRAQELYKQANLPQQWQKVAYYILHESMPLFSTLVTGSASLAANIIQWHTAKKIEDTTQTMASTNLTLYPLFVAMTTLGLGTAALKLCPDMKGYKPSTLASTRETVNKIITGPIPLLMDALGSLDLYWKSLSKRNPSSMSPEDVSAWLALADTLEMNVAGCQDLVIAIKESSTMVDLPDNIQPATLMDSTHLYAEQRAPGRIDAHHEFSYSALQLRRRI